MYEYRATITEVYDGDTVRADVDFGFSIWQKHVPIRLRGINAPEMRGATLGAAKKSRDALRSMVLGKEVVLRTYKDSTEKYGRYLGQIVVEGTDVNAWMVADGWAVPYDLALGKEEKDA